MATSSIPVDLCNPGQVFACLGLMESTEILVGASEGRFAWHANATQAIFELTGPGDADPVHTAVQFLASCEVFALAAPDSSLTAAKWDVRTKTAEHGYYPGPVPDSAATLPVQLEHAGFAIPIAHWIDGDHCGRDNVKFWAGAGGYPGAALTRDAVSCVSRLDAEGVSAVARAPFAFAAPMGSSFRFDWRRDYVPLDAGFSPNDQPGIGMVGFPLVELLAAIGLQHARPARIEARNKLAYRYHVSVVPLNIALARAVLGSGNFGIPTRAFHLKLGWPGKKGQARCIIHAEEEFR